MSESIPDAKSVKIAQNFPPPAGSFSNKTQIAKTVGRTFCVKHLNEYETPTIVVDFRQILIEILCKSCTILGEISPKAKKIGQILMLKKLIGLNPGMGFWVGGSPVWSLGGGGGVGSEMLNVWGHRTHLADFFHVLCP